MQANELIRQLLKLEGAWEIEQIEVDEPSRRIDITLGHGKPKKRFLFWGGRGGATSKKILLRHLPISGMRTFLHVPDPDTIDSDRSWAPAGSSFTHEMEAYVIDALNSCISSQAAARITGLSPSDLRKISEKTGAGSKEPEIGPAAMTATVPVDLDATHSFDLFHAGKVPEKTHANWQRLIAGELQLQNDAVGLRMLLNQIRREIELNPTETTRMSGIGLLRQYFIKNQHILEQDIRMLTGESIPHATTDHSEVALGRIPGNNDPIWQELINGATELRTDNVGLQMMLKQVRLSVEKNPLESSRLAAAKILRQFFLKHEDRLQRELSQLEVGYSATVVPLTAALRTQNIPAGSDPCWQRLIMGDINLQTNIVGLQMMLERVRQTIERDPTITNQLAAGKILRQFFIKHGNKLTSEISQLGGVSANISAASISLVDVPRESDFCWLNLINGRAGLRTNAVNLQMMLERVRQSVQRNPSEPNQKAAVKILRQFFVKHQHRLQLEIRQLSESAPSANYDMGMSGQVNIPLESAAVWQRLINGEFEIMTDVVALKMMLERIRLSIQNNPSSATKMAGAKILRQYFIKHQHKHQAELVQLMAA